MGGGAALIGVLALLSTALISPLSANRALPVRVFVTAVWLLTGFGMAIWSIAIRDINPIAAWTVLYIFLYVISLFIAVSERERLGQRVRQSIPRQRLRRLFVFPFYSGAANGVAWSSLMIFLTLLALSACLIVFPHIRTHDDIEPIGALAGVAMYVFSYALGASLIRRWFLANRVPNGYTWAIALVLLVIAITIIPLILFFSSGEWNEEWFIGSPIILFTSLSSGDNDFLWTSVFIAAISALIIGILSIPWLVRQITDFRAPSPEGTSEPQTDEPEKPSSDLKSTSQA